MLLVYKQPGELLNELLVRVRGERGIQANVPLTYAGRLDPLAEGVVILLAGDEVHKKEEYTKLTKRYTFDVLLGVGTDTYDPLGNIEQVHAYSGGDEVLSVANTFIGMKEQKYPLFSSKTVQGTPLFALTRAGASVEQPAHMVEMLSLELVGTRKIFGGVLSGEARERIDRVGGDFRQAEILNSWRNFGEEYQTQEFTIVRFVAVVGSGFYIRQFAHDLGEKLGVPALAWWIRRDAVGDYTIDGYGN